MPSEQCFQKAAQKRDILPISQSESIKSEINKPTANKIIRQINKFSAILLSLKGPLMEEVRNGCFEKNLRFRLPSFKRTPFQMVSLPMIHWH